MNNENNTVVAFRDRDAASALPAFGTAVATGASAAAGGAATKRTALGKAYSHSGSA